jgi:hypothetical protein
MASVITATIDPSGRNFVSLGTASPRVFLVTNNSTTQQLIIKSDLLGSNIDLKSNESVFVAAQKFLNISTLGTSARVTVEFVA